MLLSQDSIIDVDSLGLLAYHCDEVVGGDDQWGYVQEGWDVCNLC